MPIALEHERATVGMADALGYPFRPIPGSAHEREPIGEWDSGFMVVYSDAPSPEELDRDAESELACLHCLIDDDPALGRGLDLAREHGVADLDDDGEWVVGDLSRLERD